MEIDKINNNIQSKIIRLYVKLKLNKYKVNMKYLGYLDWKNWDEEKFGIILPGNQFHFDQIFKGKIKKESKILEIGFGNGELLEYFTKLGHSVTGVEINDTLVQRGIKFGYECYFGIAWKIPELKNQKYDLIVALAVAEHVDFEELNYFFLWAKNHLNENGTLHLKFPEGASPLGLGYQNGDFTHVSCLTKTKIDALCKLTNMKIIKYSDEPLVSNNLCSLGLSGRLILYILQLYSTVLKIIIKIILFPLCPSLKLSTNSIVVISSK